MDEDLIKRTIIVEISTYKKIKRKYKIVVTAQEHGDMYTVYSPYGRLKGHFVSLTLAFQYIDALVLLMDGYAKKREKDKLKKEINNERFK